jgi:hypothetical protein
MPSGNPARKSFPKLSGHTCSRAQGCQMVCFQTKSPNLGKFGRVLQWKMLVYFADTWSILGLTVIFYGHWVEFVAIWHIFLVLVFCVKKNLATLIVYVKWIEKGSLLSYSDFCRSKRFRKCSSSRLFSGLSLTRSSNADVLAWNRCYDF